MIIPRLHGVVIRINARTHQNIFPKRFNSGLRGKILEDYQLFDIYEGDQIKEGFKSMAYSITFRAKYRTLEEADVTSAMKKILNGLKGMGIELRS